MKRRFVIVLMGMCLCCLQMVASGHFISDVRYRVVVEKAFHQKMNLVGKGFFCLEGLRPTVEEKEALEFLYAYMPVADVTDYPTSFFLDNVRTTLKARRTMPWGGSVPELLFRHFVLPIRVNNENLDSARMVLYGELRERVSGLSMKEAILEVNHWCHEHVTYQPSNARTLSPLACMKTAIGRCGEESTFAVAALRAVGIPARQVYTPRWAHTDDNHAWVEAWADGEWHFIGACEPEPVLDLGWFNQPASRALLMHTKAFGDYRGDEEVMLRTSNYTEINLIGNYAPTARIDFQVVSAAGEPVEGAQVEFKIYNYAEFYTAVNKYTDQRGRTFLTAGRGDMVVWASKNGAYGWVKASFGKDKELTIRLTRNENTDVEQRVGALDSLDIVPPASCTQMPQVPEEMAEKNRKRLAEEDRIRKSYEATFYQGGANHGLENYLRRARGNWRTIERFINRHPDRSLRVEKLLSTLCDKDLHDISLSILEDHFLAESDQLDPRVEDEMLVLPYKRAFERAFPDSVSQGFRQDPARLVAWTRRHIRLNPDTKALRIAQTPIGVWRSRLTDSRSRDIFFVSMARSLGIEARKDAVTSKVQYREKGVWRDVNFETEEQKTAATGRLKLMYAAAKGLPDDPKYYSHFTLSKIENGRARLLNFEEGSADGGEGTTWSNTFREGTVLDEGTYLLVSGTRLASGGVLSAYRFFNIRAGETTELPLVMRHSESEISVIGSFDSESKFVKDGQEVSLLSQTGRGYFVVALLGMGEEPTNHALRDLAKAKATLDNWQRPFVFLFANERELERFRSENFGTLPSRLILGIDPDGRIRRSVAAALKLDSPTLSPIFLIADTFNRVVFISQGYTIGLGEQLEKVAARL